MIIVCPSCGKNFDVDENLIPDKGRLLKCGSCNQTWFFNKNKNVEVKSSTNEVFEEEKPKIQKKKIRKPESNFSNNTKKGSELVKVIFGPSSYLIKALSVLFVISSVIFFLSISIFF